MLVRETLATAAMTCAIVGCSGFNPRGDGFRESFTEAAKVERPAEPSAPAFGVSTKAREIERDFGVR